MLLLPSGDATTGCLYGKSIFAKRMGESYLTIRANVHHGGTETQSRIE